MICLLLLLLLLLVPTGTQPATAPTGSENRPRPIDSSQSRDLADPGALGRGEGCWAPPLVGTDATERGSSAASTCEVDRVALTDLSVARFEREYRGLKPVIVTGATADWNATKHWRKETLLHDHGDARVELGHPSEIVAFGGTGSTFSTLGRFISGFGDGNASKDRFVFDSSEVLQQRPKLRADFATPAPFVRMMAESRGGLPWDMLSIGDDGAGLSFHSHGDSWLGLVHGAKRWFIYPPGTAPRQLFETLGPIAPPMHQWVQRSLPELPIEAPRHLLDCLQEPGEAVYVPAGWLHATLNLGETIGAGGQAHWPATARLDLMSRASVHDAEVHRNFAIANHHLGNTQLALQHIQHARELGKGEDISLKIKLVEELGAAKQGVDAVATALQALDLLDKLASSADGSAASSNIAVFYYELASKMASVGVSEEKLYATLERAFSLVPGVRAASVEASVEQRSVAGELTNGAAEHNEDRQHSAALGKEESAVACRIALQLAIGASKQQRWHEAARWLREALRVPRALSKQQSRTARVMLLEAETLTAQTVPVIETPGSSPRQDRSPSQHSNVGKRTRTKPNALKRRRAKP